MTNAVLIGEAVAGESAQTRNELESLVNGVNKSNFDIGELLLKIRSNGYYTNWGFNTFYEYTESIKLKRSKAEYLSRIPKVMAQVGIERTKYEPLGTAKLRIITSLKPEETWVNPETKEETPMSEFIVGFVEKGEAMELEEIKSHVRLLKGLFGDNELVWLNVCVKKAAMDETIRPALELAKNFLGSSGKDEDGMSKDASDGAALEMVAVEYLNDPKNNVMKEEE